MNCFSCIYYGRACDNIYGCSDSCSWFGSCENCDASSDQCLLKPEPNIEEVNSNEV